MELLFSLCAFVVHSGHASNSGHYFSYVKVLDEAALNDPLAWGAGGRPAEAAAAGGAAGGTASGAASAGAAAAVAAAAAAAVSGGSSASAVDHIAQWYELKYSDRTPHKFSSIREKHAYILCYLPCAAAGCGSAACSATTDRARQGPKIRMEYELKVSNLGIP